MFKKATYRRLLDLVDLDQLDDEELVDEDGNPIDMCRGEHVNFTDPLRTLSALPIFIFAFTCHQNVLQVRAPSLPRPLYPNSYL